MVLSCGFRVTFGCCSDDLMWVSGYQRARFRFSRVGVFVVSGSSPHGRERKRMEVELKEARRLVAKTEIDVNSKQKVFYKSSVTTVMSYLNSYNY